MAIDWGAWEGSSPNRLRIGIDVSWEAISHSEGAATATIKVYLDAEGNWSDTQTITLTGSASGSVTFSNNQNNNSVLRKTDTYVYTYSGSSYGSSPGTRTFGASLSGAFNGATPSNSVTKSIPARPYGAPAAPTNVNTSRVSETSAKTTWTNRDTAGEPWDSVHVQRDDAANDVWNTWVGSLSGGATSFTDTGLASNYAYRYRVMSRNSINDSSQVEGDLIYTTPAAPTNLVRTGANGANQVLTWDNKVSAYVDHRYRVERSVNDGAWVEIASGLARNLETYTDTYGATHPAERIKYRVRANTNGGAQGTLYSGYSNESTATTGVTTPPNAPTNLSPDGSTVISPKVTKTFTWQWNPTDLSAQVSYQFQWRVVGAPSWTTLAKTNSAASSFTAAANTFTDNSTIEWQVRTWGGATTGGADGTGASPWSASALFKTVGDPNAFRERKRVMRLDLDTGKPEVAPVGVLPPIASMMLWPAESPPTGWLLADGTAYDTGLYPGLLGVLGVATLPFRADEWPTTVASVTAGVITPNTGYGVNSQNFRHLAGNMVQAICEMIRTGANLALGNPDHSNQTMGTITPTEWRPINQVSGMTNATGLRNVNVTNSGAIALAGGINDTAYTNSDILQNQVAGFSGVYAVNPPTAAPRFRWIIKAE